MPAVPLNSMQIPVLETARLRLRGYTAQDYAACCALWAEPAVVRFTVGEPQTPEAVWSRMLRYFGMWSLFGYGYWLVEEKQTGSFVGEVGFCNYKRAITPPLEDVPELGWILSPAHHGKGYATEAAQAALAWAAGSPLRAHRFACILHPENVPSRRVAEKCGFLTSHTTTYKDWPTLVLYAGSAPDQQG